MNSHKRTIAVRILIIQSTFANRLVMCEVVIYGVTTGVAHIEHLSGRRVLILIVPLTKPNHNSIPIDFAICDTVESCN